MFSLIGLPVRKNVLNEILELIQSVFMNEVLCIW